MATADRCPTLKELQTQKRLLRVELDELEAKQADIKCEISQIRSEMERLDRQIENVTKDVVVSEHAILRYLERKFSLDFEIVRAEIATEDLKDLVRKLGNGRYPIGGGLRAVVKNNVVVSIID